MRTGPQKVLISPFKSKGTQYKKKQLDNNLNHQGLIYTGTGLF